jgi:hypothetical protein
MIEEESSGWDVDRDPVTIEDACLSVSLAQDGGGDDDEGNSENEGEQ